MWLVGLRRILSNAETDLVAGDAQALLSRLDALEKGVQHLRKQVEGNDRTLTVSEFAEMEDRT